MTTYEFSDVILVPFPFTDQTTTKKRPAVVVSSEKYNSGRPDLIIMAITSRMHQMDKLGEKLVADRQGAGLLKPSVFKPILYHHQEHPGTKASRQPPERESSCPRPDSSRYPRIGLDCS
jgi:mRNA interferase MazF